MHERPETNRFYRMRLPHWEVAGGRYFVTIRLKGAIPDEGLQRIRYHLELAESAIALGCTGCEERRQALAEMERCLHTAPRVAHLANQRVADCVTEAIQYRENEGVWTMFSYVVMPNHVHLFFRLGPRNTNTDSVDLSRCSRALDERASPFFPDAEAVTPPPSSQAHRASDYGITAKRPHPSSQAHRASDYNAPPQQLYLDRVIMDFKRWTAGQAASILGVPGESFWQREWFDHWSRSAEEDEAIDEYIRCNPLHVGK